MNNRRAKKWIAILVMLMLSVTTLAGCSVTDAAYMALLKETANIESFSFQGEYTMEFPDPNAPSSYSPLPFGGFSSRQGGMMTVGMKLSGAGMQTKDGGFYLDCTIQYGINDRRMPHSLSVLFVDDEIGIPVKDCIDAILIYYKHIEGYSDRMCSSLRAALEKELAEHDYVIINMSEEALEETPAMMRTGFMMSNTAAMTGSQAVELSNAMIDSFTKMFSGLSSGMTKRDGSGITLEVTPENAMTFAGNLTKYMQSNKRSIYREMLNLLKAMEETYRDGDMTKEFYRMARFELEDAEQDFYEVIDEIAKGFADLSDFDKELLLLTFKDSYLKHTLSKSGNTISDRFDANVTYMGEKYFSMKGQSTTTKASVDPKAINAENPIDAEELGDVIDRVYLQVNPAREIEITWWGADSKRAWATVRRVEGRDWTSFEMFMSDGSLYLPMRPLCELFGEEVGWDNAAKRAYVVRDDMRIAMEGKLEYATLFVKVRDFEKLGYTVEYDRQWGENVVTLKK